jgi:hypothetical protein
MTRGKDTPTITGRGYCGASLFRAAESPLSVVYCQCRDCRRVTGAPVTVWAAFAEAAVTFTPDEGRVAAPNPGATRTFCGACGSSLACRYDYLPGQVHIPIGILDQAAELAPELHAHAAERLPWLTIDDKLERFPATSRSRLAQSRPDTAATDERAKP